MKKSFGFILFIAVLVTSGTLHGNTMKKANTSFTPFACSFSTLGITTDDDIDSAMEICCASPGSGNHFQFRSSVSNSLPPFVEKFGGKHLFSFSQILYRANTPPFLLLRTIRV